MQTEEEKNFIVYWEEIRTKHKKWQFKFARSFSEGIIFGIFMIIFFLVDGQRDRALVSHADLIFIMIGALAIAVFYAVLRSTMLWDKNETKYTILKLREEKEASETMPTELPG
jgi:hypothetical protein